MDKLGAKLGVRKKVRKKSKKKKIKKWLEIRKRCFAYKMLFFLNFINVGLQKAELSE